jgi:hypothetical protein
MHTIRPHRLLACFTLPALLACFALPALAEEAAPAPAVPAHGELGRPGEGVHIIHGGGHAQAVRNAPYSAQTVAEQVQQLPDGNQIERRTRSASYRDSAGRTRHEIRNEKGELRTVTIIDPVAAAIWVLNPQTRSAQRLPARPELERLARGARDEARKAVRVQVERLRREGRLPASGRTEDEDGVTIHVERRIDDQADEKRDDKRDERRETVRIVRMPATIDAARIGPQIAPMIAGAVSGALADHRWSSRAVSRDLGTRDFDGVKAEGKQRSYEIPAGEVGNRNPIVVVDETWYAPDLQVTVYAKHSDPRTGDYVYRLEGLRRGEPDAALFAVPSDYQVREPGKRVTGKNAE